MTISFYLKRPKAEDATAIFAKIYYEGLILKYYTSEKIHPDFWNTDTQRAKQTQKFREYPEFNRRLDNFATDVKNICRSWMNDNNGTIPAPDKLKELIDREVTKKQPKKDAITFFSYYEEINQRSKEGRRVKPGSGKATVYNTGKGYITTLAHLKEFQKIYKRKIDFETIDLEFYNDYTEYLTKSVRLSPNTIGDHIKRLKTILSEATEKGHNTNPAFRSKYFVKPSEKTESIYLNEEELKKIAALDLSGNPTMDKVRDLFLIGCYTGQRVSDWQKITPANLYGDYVRITQQKTGRQVSIPVHDTVRDIWAKYGGGLPNSISDQKTNEYLKEIGKTIPAGKKEPVLNDIIPITYTKGGDTITKNCRKWELLTTHVGRRSFATNQYLAGMPPITIMAITNHRTETDFMRYLKLSSDDHAKIALMHWKKDKELNRLKAV